MNTLFESPAKMALIVAGLCLAPTLSMACNDTNNRGNVDVCRSVGSPLPPSNHTNLQQCTLTLYACVDMGLQRIQGITTTVGSLPSATVGVIAQPYGADWCGIEGNNGYVTNVCNGNASSSGLMSMVSLFNDSASSVSGQPFSAQLTEIQRQCRGKCEAFPVNLSYNVNVDNAWVASGNGYFEIDRSRTPFNSLTTEFRAISYVTAKGPVYWDGFTVRNDGVGTFMGIGGHRDEMAQQVSRQVGGKPDNEMSAADAVAVKLTGFFRYHFMNY
jgi:hypothetical protein